MREMLTTFKRETLIEFICQRFFFSRGKKGVEHDLLFIEWDIQAKAAQKMMDDACAQLDKAETPDQHLAARKEFEKGLTASKRADRIYKKLEALR